MIDPSAPYEARRAAFDALFKEKQQWRNKETGLVYRITYVAPGHWGVWLERKMTKEEKERNQFLRERGDLGPREGRLWMTVEYDPDEVREKRRRFPDLTHVSEWEFVG